MPPQTKMNAFEWGRNQNEIEGEIIDKKSARDRKDERMLEMQ